MFLTDANHASRTAPASRARLRGGKLMDMTKAPISVCTLYDLENGNTGLILPAVDGPDLPDTFYVEDEGDLSLGLAQVQRRTRPHLEIAFIEAPVRMNSLVNRSGNTQDTV